MNLDLKEWDNFFVSDLFENVQRGKRIKKENQIRGNIPYVSSSSQNNGIDNFIGNTEKVRFFSNCISLANSGSVGSCFYEPFEYVASDHVTLLKNKRYNKYTYLFISTMLNRLSEKYNFNREINDKRIQREKIILPKNDSSFPDYKYMENYILEKERKLKNKYVSYMEEKIKTIKPKEICDICEKQFGIFQIKDIVDEINIAKSKDYGKLAIGDTVFIGRQETNNGLQGFKDTDISEKKDCITISMVATKMMSFWQQYDFAASQNILVLRNYKFNKYNSLFICSILNNKLLTKYDYGNPVKISTFPKERIMLPIKDNKIDYDYMEQYVKNKMFNQYCKYLEFLKN